MIFIVLITNTSQTKNFNNGYKEGKREKKEKETIKKKRELKYPRNKVSVKIGLRISRMGKKIYTQEYLQIKSAG